MFDKRIATLRAVMGAQADARDAAIQQQYHKSQLRFYGVKTDERRRIAREIFTAHPQRKEIDAAARELWSSDCWDEKMVALGLYSAVVHELAPPDIALLLEMTHQCDGWALLDTLATELLGSLALVWGEPVYDELRRWSGDGWLWTRRASILAHIIPARKRELAEAYAWPTWEEHLPEKDFFIRKAIGWALREATKHYPREVHAFLKRVGLRASPLTLREGARNLPEPLRSELLG